MRHRRLARPAGSDALLAGWRGPYSRGLFGHGLGSRPRVGYRAASIGCCGCALKWATLIAYGPRTSTTMWSGSSSVNKTARVGHRFSLQLLRRSLLPLPFTSGKPGPAPAPITSPSASFSDNSGGRNGQQISRQELLCVGRYSDFDCNTCPLVPLRRLG